MTDSTGPSAGFPELALDSLSAALLVVFVGLLFLGYFDPSFPYDSLALLPLVGSLGILFWSNRRADILDRSTPTDSRA